MATDNEKRIAALEQRVAMLEDRLRPREERHARHAPAPPATWAAEAPPRSTQPSPTAGDRVLVLPWELNPSRLLAIVGGLVLLFGAGFLVRYAMAQGWLGPHVRVALAVAGGAGLAVLGTRLERVEATRVVGQVCTATGAAVAYVAVVAAATGYRIVPAVVGLLAALAIAAAATAQGVWSRSQPVAALGIGGVVIAPALVDAVVGLPMMLLVVAGAAAGVGVATRREWPAISALAFALAMPQIVLAGDAPVAAALTLMGSCGLLFGAAGVVHGSTGDDRHRVAGMMLGVVNAVTVAGLGWLMLSDAATGGNAPAWWVAGVGISHLVAGACICLVRPGRTAATAFATVGLVLVDVAVSLLLDGDAVTGFLAVTAILIALSARLPLLWPTARVAFPVQLVAFGVQALAFDVRAPAAGSAEAVLMAALLSAAAVVAGVAARSIGRAAAVAGGATFLGVVLLRLLTVEAPPVALLLGTDQLFAALAICTLSAAGAGVLGSLVHRRFTHLSAIVVNYGASLAAVALDPDGVGRVALTGLWAAGGAAALVLGRRWGRQDVRRGGGALLLAAVVKAVLVDTTLLDGTNRAVALLLCGTVLVATAIVEARAAAAGHPEDHSNGPLPAGGK